MGLVALAATALTLGLVATKFSEGKSDAELLADEVGAERCSVPTGSTGGVYTCEFGGGVLQRCYGVEWRPADRGDVVFHSTLRHDGACSAADRLGP